MTKNTVNNFESLDNQDLAQVVGGGGWMDYLKIFFGQNSREQRSFVDKGYKNF